MSPVDSRDFTLGTFHIHELVWTHLGLEHLQITKVNCRMKVNCKKYILQFNLELKFVHSVFSVPTLLLVIREKSLPMLLAIRENSRITNRNPRWDSRTNKTLCVTLRHDLQIRIRKFFLKSHRLFTQKHFGKTLHAYSK